MPAWLNVRPVARKLRRRIESLRNGESPEELKLGRELSAAACIRLFKDLESMLRDQPGQASTEIGDIDLVFGHDNLYAAIKGKELNPRGELTEKPSALAHQRMAIFGFDRQSQMPTAVRKIEVASERWTLVDGKAVRAPIAGGARRQSPCLVAATRQGEKRLGVLFALQATESGTLSGGLHWYDETPAAGWMRPSPAQGQDASRTPAFLLRGDDGDISLLLPASASIRLDVELRLMECPVNRLIPTEVLERGVDFVRYACRLADQ